MKIQQFLDHYGIAANPFADEDAQTDQVFKGSCIQTVFHPAWDKIYGDPSEPATSVVFGEKGSGKTALRLQMVRRLTDYNAEHPEHQVLVIQYDDFNPFLDRFRDRFSAWRRRIDRVLGQWRLWDHVDAILSLGVTQVVDRILEVRQARHPAARDESLPVESLDRSQKRDVLLLAAYFDQSTADTPLLRWRRLRKRLGWPNWWARWHVGLGVLVTVAWLALIIWLRKWHWLGSVWPYLILAAGWLPAAWRWLKTAWQAWRVERNTPVLHHNRRMLQRILLGFPASELVGQPAPVAPRTDDRYELLGKLQGVLRALHLDGILVLVDRVDEPYLITGSVELMRELVWPMLDNKLLKHPGMGVKLLLPIELERQLDRQEREFYQRARLDKQNLIRSLAWTGQSLYDLANARLRACVPNGQAPVLADLFAAEVDERRLKEASAMLRVPRQLFKFIYRLLTTHCNAHSDREPVWTISSGTFESVLAVHQRDQEAFERGVGAG
jgi:hypothetical protein